MRKIFLITFLFIPNWALLSRAAAGLHYGAHLALQNEGPESGPIAAKFGAESPKLGPSSARFDPSWARVGQHWPEVDQTWPKFGQSWPELSQVWPTLARHRQNLAPERPNLLDLGPESSNIGPDSTKFGPNSTRFESAGDRLAMRHQHCHPRCDNPSSHDTSPYDCDYDNAFSRDVSDPDSSVVQHDHNEHGHEPSERAGCTGATWNLEDPLADETAHARCPDKGAGPC